MTTTAALRPSDLNESGAGIPSDSLDNDVNNSGSSSAKPTLPTLDKLGISSLPADIDPVRIATGWFTAFSQFAQLADVRGILSLLVLGVEEPWWRDMLAMTWDFRTFYGVSPIKQFLHDRLGLSKLSSFKLDESAVTLERPYPDIAWIQAFFSFDTDVGHGSGIFRLVPLPATSGTVWKGYTVFTNLEDLKGFPEKIGSLRDFLPNHGKWAEKRRREVDFEGGDPKVIIVGGGQAGLEVAARLKFLDIPSLVVEKHPTIGQNWRTRYKALCLHDVVWYDHMPYIPFPPSWPVYTPAVKLADWLESYAHSMELNVWTSSTITQAKQNEDTKHWTITVKRGENGPERTFHTNHLVFAIGMGGGNPNMPKFPGMDEFEGRILHSSQYNTARDNLGKKVVVVGSCTSAHDICADHVDHGVDITMIQRGPTYITSTKKGIPRILHLYSEDGPSTDKADRINASFPIPQMKLVLQRITKEVAELDKEILEGLTAHGFKLGWGEDGAGFLHLVYARAGGYYLDVGASQMIIDGKIKLKNDSPIERFTKSGIEFQNGTVLAADVVIFSTGYGDARDSMTRIIGDKYKSKLKKIWGLDGDGEVNGVWRDIGVPNLYFVFGNLALDRFLSKHLALQIKAIEEGVFGTRYSRDS